MSRGLLLTIVGALLVGVLVFFWVQEFGGLGAAENPEVGPAAAADRKAEDRNTIGGQTPGTDPTDESREAERAALANAKEPDADVDMILIVVVDRATDAPVPHADVLYAKPRQHRVTAEQLRLAGKDYEAYLRTFGVVVKADRAGRVHVPRPRGFGQFYGRLGALQGNVTVDPAARIPEGGLRLRLSLDFNLVVRVVDDGGKPASPVTVSARTRFRSHEDPTKSSPGRSNTAMTEPPEGEARFAHGHNQVFNLVDKNQRDVRYETFCHIPGFQSETVVALNADGSVRKERVEFCLPPTGRLNVHLQDHTGRPVHGVFQMNVRLHGDSGARVDYTKSNAKGVFTLPYVGLAREFVLETRLGQAVLRRTVKGPTRPGETIRVDLRLGENQVILTGRAVNEKGHVFGDRTLTLGSSNQARTDQRGRFRFFLSDWWRGRKHAARIHLTDVASRRTGLTAEIDLRIDLSGGTHDLGDVVFAKPPIVVAGVILGDGKPVTKEIGFGIETFDEETRKWRHAQGVTFLLLDEGRFEAVGQPKPGRFRLIVETLLFLDKGPREFTLGEKNVRIELIRGGDVRVAVDIGRDLPNGCIQLQLRPSAGQPGYEPFRAGRPKDRTFGRNPEFGILFDRRSRQKIWFWGGRKPGTYDLLVFATGKPEPIHRVEGIRVRAGVEADDARLRPLDLSDKLRVLRITIVGPDEKRIQTEKGGVFVLPTDEKQTLDGRMLAEGVASFLTPDRSLDLLIALAGFERQVVRGVVMDRTITVVPSKILPTEFRIEGGLPTLPRNMYLEVRCRPTPRSERSARRFFARRDEYGHRDTLGNVLRPRVNARFRESATVTLPLRVGQRYDVELNLYGEGKFVAVKRSDAATITAAKGLKVHLMPISGAMQRAIEKAR